MTVGEECTHRDQEGRYLVKIYVNDKQRDSSGTGLVLGGPELDPGPGGGGASG